MNDHWMNAFLIGHAVELCRTDQCGAVINYMILSPCGVGVSPSTRQHGELPHVNKE